MDSNGMHEHFARTIGFMMRKLYEQEKSVTSNKELSKKQKSSNILDSKRRKRNLET